MIYNTNATISSKIIVKKEGDISNPPFQICFIPFYIFAFDEMVIYRYKKQNQCSYFCCKFPQFALQYKKRTNVCTKGEVHMTNEDYKKLINELLKQIEDNKLLEALFYVIQKLVGRGF